MPAEKPQQRGGIREGAASFALSEPGMQCYHSRMSNPLSDEFIFSFVSACHDAGLTKEAAAELLQREAIKAAAPSAAFREGYAAVYPAPVLHECDFVEKAAFGKAVGRVIGGVGGALGGVKDVAVAAGGAAKRGISRLAGKPQPMPNGTMRESIIAAHPKSSVAAGVGLTAGGSYLAHRLGASDAGLPGAPTLSPGGYNRDEESKSYDAELEQKSRGIADLDKRLNQSNLRRKELADAVARGDRNSHMAAQELRELDRERERAGATRKKFLSQLDGAGAATEEKLKSLEKRRATLENSRTSWTGIPRRLWYSMDGDGLTAQQKIDQELDRTQSGIGAATTDKRIMDKQRSRVVNGYVQTPPQRTSAQIQKDFFPTYD